MNSLMISVIVPAYNVEKYVYKCLSSIQEQTYQNWEAIVIDDGATDKTGMICEQFKLCDERFRVFHLENKGVGQARNFALNKAKGEIIGFVDADDFLCKYAFESIASHFKDKYIDALYVGHSRVNEDEEVIEKRYGLQYIENGSIEAVKSTLIEGEHSYLGVLWNKYFRRKCIYKKEGIIKFSADYKIGEDQIWLLEVCRNIKKIGYEPSLLYNYRIRNGSAVHAFEITDAKKSEIDARNMMVTMVDEYFPDLSTLARIKYRNCLNALAIMTIKQRNSKLIKYVVPYSQSYYRTVIKSDISLKRKIKESLLQGIYIILSKTLR